MALTQLKHSSKEAVTRNQPQPKWYPHPDDFVKINMDAAFIAVADVGLGVAIRDSLGDVHTAASKRTQARWSPDVAECKAAVYGLRLADRFGCNKVVLESDCLNIISRAKNPISVLNDFDLILDDLLFISSKFESLVWSYVK